MIAGQGFPSGTVQSKRDNPGASCLCPFVGVKVWGDAGLLSLMSTQRLQASRDIGDTSCFSEVASEEACVRGTLEECRRAGDMTQLKRWTLACSTCEDSSECAQGPILTAGPDFLALDIFSITKWSEKVWDWGLQPLPS